MTHIKWHKKKVKRAPVEPLLNLKPEHIPSMNAKKWEIR